MAGMSFTDLAKKMRELDFAMLNTRGESGDIAGRPMSNNAEVDYDGDSYFFTWDASRMADDIRRDPKVSLAFQGSKGLLGKPGIFINVEGEAELAHDKAQFAQHWNKGMERWFKDGVDTPGMVMIKVHATRIHYWDGEDEGEVAPPR